MKRTISSPYMHWAKTRSGSRFNLASSGLRNMTTEEFPVPPEAVALSGASFYGFPPLQEALAKHCGVAETNVFASIGTSMANFVAMAALIEPGDEVLIEHPVYDLLPCAAQFLQAQVTWLPRPASLGFQPDLDALRERLSTETRLIVLTNLHNPSSAYLSEDTLREIGRLARAVGARVLVDEVYLDAAFDQKPKSAFHLGPEFVVTNSLTKVYGLSGLRCGWVLAEPGLVERMWRLSDLFHVIPSHAAEKMSIVALGRINELKSRSQAILARNRALVNMFLAQRKELDCAPLERGMTIFPKLKGIAVDALCELLRHKHETTIVPGSFFDMPEHFRLSLGGDTAIIEEGLKRVGLALKELGG
jgi:aspartate/methionine/tyrosine aminotransferase